MDPPPPWHCKPFFKQTTYNIQVIKMLWQYLKFLKKLCCCLGGEYNRVIQADILSISPSLIVLFSSSVTIAYYLHTGRIDDVKQIMRVNYNWLKKFKNRDKREIRIHYGFWIVSLLSNCLGEYSYSQLICSVLFTFTAVCLKLSKT